MAISVKQTATAQANDVNISIGSSTNPVIGNTIIVACFASSFNSGSMSCADNAGNTYTQQGSIIFGSSGIVIFSAPVTATTSGFSITISAVATFTSGITGIFVEVSGLTANVDTDSQAYSGSTIQDPGSITTTYNTDFIFAVMASNDATASITDSPSNHGWTGIAQYSSASGPYELGDFCYRISNTFASFDPQWTTDSMSGDCGAIQIAFIGVGALTPDSVFAQSFNLLMH